MIAAPRLGDLLARVAEAGRALALSAPPSADLVGLCEQLLGGRGEATGLARAAVILERYRALDAAGRAGFFAAVAARFGVDRPGLEAAVARWRESGADADARALHEAAEPRSQELIRRLNAAPGGPAALVAMRADLLAAVAAGLPDTLDGDFRHLFASWFNRGFLKLRRIDWNSPAAVLEKIIRYEAVHAIASWDDLRRRVAAPDRRLYAFFHPALRDEPLIFVEVALTAAVPAAIGPILAGDRAALDPAAARVATFYSISNCHQGLRGVSFGSFLIKQVAETLRAEFPALTGFVTLSPVPGLRAWAEAEAVRPGGGALDPAEAAAVAALRDADPDAVAARAGAVAALCARYLLTAKRPDGGPRDPVARFHLGNGAALERINPGGDASPRGLAASWGAMVNYRYDLDRIEPRHEGYAERGEIAAAPALRRLLGPR